MQTERIEGLAVNIWPGAGATVVGLAGLGSTGRSWINLAWSLPDARVVGPDLRGRGGSTGLPGPTGLAAHARDVAAVCTAMDLHDVVVVGHSMGAYLAPLVAEELAGRVTKLVLLDGGVRPKFPWFLGPRATRLTFRLSTRRAAKAWPDAAAYLDASYGKALASRPDLMDAALRWADADLGPDGPGGRRPQLDADRAVADAIDSFFGADVQRALAGLGVPAHLLAARYKITDSGKPFISDEAIEEWTGRVPMLTAERVQANHVTLPWLPEVTAAIKA